MRGAKRSPSSMPDVREAPGSMHVGGLIVPREHMDDVFGLLAAALKVSTRPRMRLSRWERILIYFGLMRDPRPYVHMFAPVFPTIGRSMTVTELWADWGWVE